MADKGFALVTGGSRGIGKAICLRLAREGYSILLNYRSRDEEAQQTAALIEATGVKCELLKFNVSRKEEVDASVQSWLEQNQDQRISVLVNNAGVREDGLMATMTDEQWKNVIGTSLDSFFYVTRLVVMHMLLKRAGSIINIVSLAGLKGNAGQTNYSAAKAGLIGATKALAQEVGKRGITVNAVAPGFVETDMTEDLDASALSGLIPLKRFGKPEEIAGVVAFLASSDASYITGEVINVNGGLYS